MFLLLLSVFKGYIWVLLCKSEWKVFQSLRAGLCRLYRTDIFYQHRRHIKLNWQILWLRNKDSIAPPRPITSEKHFWFYFPIFAISTKMLEIRYILAKQKGDKALNVFVIETMQSNLNDSQFISFSFCISHSFSCRCEIKLQKIFCYIAFDRLKLVCFAFIPFLPQ